MATQLKYIRGSKYKCVALFVDTKGNERWRMKCFGNGCYKDTEREAAIAVDKAFIRRGKPPVNILKPK